MISRDDGLCAMGYAPCSVRYRLSGASVRVDVESDYPASGIVHITVHTDTKAAFPIHLRIPEWANGATVAVERLTMQLISEDNVRETTLFPRDLSRLEP